MENINEIRENYANNLKAVDYVNMMAKAKEDDARALEVPQSFIFDILKSGRFKGTRLLELGSGAMVTRIASASAFYPNIIMSDYVEDNCEELKRWLKGESTLQQFLDIPAQLEGYTTDLESGIELLETRIRKNVKQVVRCDVLSDNIFLEKVEPAVAPPYDLIMSCYCLEAAAPDFEGFVLILKRINKLLHPKAGLILLGFVNGKRWKVDQNDYHYIQVTETDLRKALKESGFGNIDIRVYDKLKFDYDHESLYCLAAQKM